MRRIAVTLLTLLLCCSAASQVVIEEVGVLQEQLGRAELAYSDGDYPKALAHLDPLIARLDKLEKSGKLQAADEDGLLKALELRGLSLFASKKVDRAKEDFIRLIQNRPEYSPVYSASPKARKLLDECRDKLTGRVTIMVEPPEATLRVDGRDLGSAYPRSLPLLKGIHELAWSLQGYDPVQREVEVEVGQSTAVEVKLAPNSKTIFFLVQPKGTRLFIGKKLIGEALRPASGQEELARSATENGLDPAETFVIDASNLPPGQHKVTLSSECHESREFVVTISVDRSRSVAGYTKPIVLQRKAVTLKVVSRPAGAMLTLDGKAVGKTPFVQEEFCIGEHEVLLSKEGAGTYRAKVNVQGDESFLLDVELRPTLLWAGMTRDQETSPAQAQVIEENLSAKFAKLEQFNGVLSQEPDPLLPDTFFAEGVGAEEVQESVSSLCDKYSCEGVVAGRLTREEGKTVIEIRLFARGFPGFDAYTSQLQSSLEAGNALDQIDSDIFGEGEHAPVALANLPSAGGPVVTRVFGEQGGASPGDIMLAVDGQQVQNAAEAYGLMDGKGSCELSLRRGANRFDCTLKRLEIFRINPYGGAEFGFRRALLLTRQKAVAGGLSKPGGEVNLLLAIANLNLGRPEDALSALRGCNLPEKGPLSLASAAYLRGVALVQLGRLEEARAELQIAVGDRSASLDGIGDVLVQPLAADLLGDLPAPPPTVIPLPGT